MTDTLTIRTSYTRDGVTYVPRAVRFVPLCPVLVDWYAIDTRGAVTATGTMTEEEWHRRRQG